MEFQAAYAALFLGPELHEVMRLRCFAKEFSAHLLS
jgi:hypothetical protein